MTLRPTLLAFLTLHLAHGQSLEKTKPTVERSSQITLPDRILTVKKLSGPPVRSAPKEVAKLRQSLSEANLPTEYHFVHAVVCEDNRTYLEWWPLSGAKGPISQGWSDLDWTHLASTTQIRSLR